MAPRWEYDEDVTLIILNWDRCETLKGQNYVHHSPAPLSLSGAWLGPVRSSTLLLHLT